LPMSRAAGLIVPMVITMGALMLGERGRNWMCVGKIYAPLAASGCDRTTHSEAQAHSAKNWARVCHLLREQGVGSSNLPAGYADYARRTRYRLLPGFW
jgi:hypothetical protein